MSLPTSPVTITKTIPSYLYFEYQNDSNLPSLIDAYNTLTQEYLDWFNNINLPIYTGLNGALLDWVGQGVYGLPRPVFATTAVNGTIGQIASLNMHGSSTIPTPNVINAISTTQILETTTDYDTPDDVYKRVLTWWFYKGDGFDWSIPWFKRRIARFLYGINGTDPSVPFTPHISVTFDDTTSPLPTCNITITSAVEPIATYFKLAIDSKILCTPFRFAYNVTITP